MFYERNDVRSNFPSNKKRLNAVGASAVASDNDTVSQRRGFIVGTCYPEWDEKWLRRVLRTEHIREERDGDRPTPFPFSTGPARRVAGWGHVPSPVPPKRAEHRRHRGGPAGREREERRGEVRSGPAGSGKRSERAASRAPGRGPGGGAAERRGAGREPGSARAAAAHASVAE